MEPIQELIIKMSNEYLGQHETPNNSGFIDKAFELEMLSVGWQRGQSWCAYSAKLVWLKAFKKLDPANAHLIEKYLNGSALESLHNARASKELHTTLENPVPGSIVVWSEGHGPSGHEGILIDLAGKVFHSNEGNTTDPKDLKGNPREGVIYARKEHRLDNPFMPKGLNIVGFISPILNK